MISSDCPVKKISTLCIYITYSCKQHFSRPFRVRCLTTPLTAKTIYYRMVLEGHTVRWNWNDCTWSCHGLYKVLYWLSARKTKVRLFTGWHQNWLLPEYTKLSSPASLTTLLLQFCLRQKPVVDLLDHFLLVRFWPGRQKTCGRACLKWSKFHLEQGFSSSGLLEKMTTPIPL